MAILSNPPNPLPHGTGDYEDESVTGAKLADGSSIGRRIAFGSSTSVTGGTPVSTGVLPSGYSVFLYVARIENITVNPGGIFFRFNDIELANYEWLRSSGITWTYTTGATFWQKNSVLNMQTMHIWRYVKVITDDANPSFSTLIPHDQPNLDQSIIGGIYNVLGDFTVTSLSTECVVDIDLFWEVYGINNP